MSCDSLASYGLAIKPKSPPVALSLPVSLAMSLVISPLLVKLPAHCKLQRNVRLVLASQLFLVPLPGICLPLSLPGRFCILITQSARGTARSWQVKAQAWERVEGDLGPVLCLVKGKHKKGVTLT